MSLKKVHDEQPDKFDFTELNLNLAKDIYYNYLLNLCGGSGDDKRY